MSLLVYRDGLLPFDGVVILHAFSASADFSTALSGRPLGAPSVWSPSLLLVSQM